MVYKLKNNLNNYYYYVINNVVYDILQQPSNSHLDSDCNEKQYFYAVEDSNNLIGSFSTTGNTIDKEKAVTHIPALIFTDDKGNEDYYWLDPYIQKGDSFSREERKFTPNTNHDAGHYVEGATISGYTQYLVELVKKEAIADYVTKNKNASFDDVKANIKRVAPYLLGEDFVYNNKKYTSVTSTDSSGNLIITDEDINTKIEETIKTMTEKYGNELCKSFDVKKTISVTLTKTT